MQGSLEEDLAALRKLRDDDASGGIRMDMGDDNDPRNWNNNNVNVIEGRVRSFDLANIPSLTNLSDAIGKLSELNELYLYNCTSLLALPDAIGELGALTELSLYGCSSLAELPAAIGELKALKTLDLTKCSSLVALPAAIGKLDALTELDLGLNTMTSNGPSN